MRINLTLEQFMQYAHAKHFPTTNTYELDLVRAVLDDKDVQNIIHVLNADFCPTDLWLVLEGTHISQENIDALLNGLKHSSAQGLNIYFYEGTGANAATVKTLAARLAGGNLPANLTIGFDRDMGHIDNASIRALADAIAQGHSPENLYIFFTDRVGQFKESTLLYFVNKLTEAKTNGTLAKGLSISFEEEDDINQQLKHICQENDKAIESKANSQLISNCITKELTALLTLASLPADNSMMSAAAAFIDSAHAKTVEQTASATGSEMLTGNTYGGFWLPSLKPQHNESKEEETTLTKASPC